MKTMTYIKTLFCTLLLSLSFSSFALDLEQAKEQGLIGEKASGYLGVPNNQEVADEVIELIKAVNNKRKARYSEIAQKNNVKTGDVAKMGHKKAMEKTVAGNFYQDATGKWVKK